MVMIVRSQKTAEGDVYGNNSFKVWFNKCLFMLSSLLLLLLLSFLFLQFNIVTINMVNKP